MKVLFFNFYAITPHIDTDFELISESIDNNDEVYIILCRRDLLACYSNMYHHRSRCVVCQSKIKDTLKRINFPKENIIYLPPIEKYGKDFPLEFENVKEIMDYKYQDYNLGYAIASNLIDHLDADHDFNPKLHKDLVKRVSSTVHYLFQAMLDILNEIKPDKMIIFNGRFSEARSILFACQKTHTNFYTHERAGTLGRYLFYKNTYPHDFYVTRNEIEDLWNKADKNQRELLGHNWFKERRKGIDQGMNSYVKYQENGLIPENFDKNKKNIIIFNSTIAEIFTLGEFNPNHIYPNEMVGVEKILNDFLDDKRFYFYIRVHPNLRLVSNSQTRFYEKIGDRYSNLTIIPPNSKVSSYALMDLADIVFVFGSTIATEACYSGKPVINVLKSRYDNLDVAYLPKSHEEVVKLIKSDLVPKDRNNALKYAYWEQTYGVKYKKFNHKKLLEGDFLGKPIKPSKKDLIPIVILKILEIRSFEQLKKLIKQIFGKN